MDALEASHAKLSTTVQRLSTDIRGGARELDNLGRGMDNATIRTRNFNTELDRLARHTSGDAGGALGGLASSFGGVGPGGAPIGAGAVVGLAAMVAPLLPSIGALATVPPMLATIAGGAIVAKVAFTGMGAAIGGSKKAFDALNESQKQFVLVIRDLYPLLNGLKNTITSNFFGPLTDAVKAVATNKDALANINGIVKELAIGMGQIAASWVRFVGSTQATQAFGQLFAAWLPLLRQMMPVFQSLILSWAQFSTAIAPLGQFLVDAFTRGAQAVANFVSNGKNAQDFVTTVERSLKLLWTVMSSLVNVFGALYQVLAPIGTVIDKNVAQALNFVADLLRKNKQLIDTDFIQAWDGVVNVIKQLAPLIGPIFTAILKYVDAATKAFDFFTKHLGFLDPIIKGLTGLIKHFGDVALIALNPVLALMKAVEWIGGKLGLTGGGTAGPGGIGGNAAGAGATMTPSARASYIRDLINNGYTPAQAAAMANSQPQISGIGGGAGAAGAHGGGGGFAGMSIGNTSGAGYINPWSGRSYARLDQGVDFGGTGPIQAIGEGYVMRVERSGSGWGGAVNSFISIMLTTGSRAGWTYYVAEGIEISPGLHGAGPNGKGGSHVTKGQVIGRQVGGIETGWVSSPTQGSSMSGNALTAQLGQNAAETGYNRNDPGATPGGVGFPQGRDFWHFLQTGGAASPFAPSPLTPTGSAPPWTTTKTRRRRPRVPPALQQLLGLGGEAQIASAQNAVAQADAAAATNGDVANVQKQVAAETKLIDVLDAEEKHLKSLHETGKLRVEQLREETILNNELAAATRARTRDETNLQRAQTTARDLGLLNSVFGAGATAGSGNGTTGLRNTYTQIMAQVKQYHIQLSAEVLKQLAVMNQIMEQKWISPQVKDIIRTRLDEIRTTIQSKVSAIKQIMSEASSTMSTFVSQMTSAFDATHSTTPAGKQLAIMQQQDTERGLVNQGNQAIQALAALGIKAPPIGTMTDDQIQAQIDGANDPQVKAAWQAYYDAQRAQEENALSEAVPGQQQDIANQKNEFERKLGTLQLKQERGQLTAKQFLQQAQALAQQYGIDPATLQAATDWSTSYQLFGQTIPQLANLLNDTSPIAKALGGLTEALNNFAKALGDTRLNPTPGGMPHAASGGVFDAVPGGVYRIAEAGHPEAVLPLDPGKNNEFWSVLNRAFRVKGFASGGLSAYTGPMQGLNDTDLSAALRTIHGPWPSPRRYGSGAAFDANRLKAMYANNSGWHFDDGWFQAAIALIGKNVPSSDWSDASYGSIWFDYPGGKHSVMDALKVAAKYWGSVAGSNTASLAWKGGTGGQGSYDPSDPFGVAGMTAGFSSSGPQNFGFASGGIPRLAGGGVIRARPGGTLVVAGEAGQDEMVVPMGRGGGGVPFRIVIESHHYLDGEKVTDVVTAHQIRNGRYGRPGISAATQ